VSDLYPFVEWKLFLYSPRTGREPAVGNPSGRPAAGSAFQGPAVHGEGPHCMSVANGVPQLLDGEPVVSGLF